MSGLSLHLEGFGGQDIEGLVKEMAAVATRIGIWVTCDINGIHVLASPDDNPEALWGNYEKARERNATFVSANVIPRGRPSADERGE